jgi:hypothetical protein
LRVSLKPHSVSTRHVVGVASHRGVEGNNLAVYCRAICPCLAIKPILRVSLASWASLTFEDLSIPGNDFGEL